MKKILLIIVVVVIVGVGIVKFIKKDSYRQKSGEPSQVAVVQTPTPEASPAAMMTAKGNRLHKITLKTNFGDITFETYDADAPKTVENFITLAKKDFYDGLTFHRVIAGFMIQGGDPKGNGTGGPGYKFDDELDPNTESAKEGYKKGVVAMANSGPNTNGSQFFIMHQDNPLPHRYNIFGKIIAGQDVVDKIAQVKTGANDKPLESVIIENVVVEKMER